MLVTFKLYWNELMGWAGSNGWVTDVWAKIQSVVDRVVEGLGRAGVQLSRATSRIGFPGN